MFLNNNVISGTEVVLVSTELRGFGGKAGSAPQLSSVQERDSLQ